MSSLITVLLLVLFLIVSIFLVVLILVQQGKGAGMGASFGAGASNTLFGSVGSANFLTKSTWFLTILFFGLSIALGYLNAHNHKANQADSFTNLEVSAPAPAASKDEKKAEAPKADAKKEEVKKEEAPKAETKEDVKAPAQEEKKAAETTPATNDQAQEGDVAINLKDGVKTVKNEIVKDAKIVKDATVETGLMVRVPLFIEQGEVIVVSPKDGSYASRA